MKNSPKVLASEIDYSEASIVSKVILKGPAGNITLFAFDQDQELSEHTAPFEAFVQVLDGEAEVFIESRKFVVSAGQYIILPANVPHALYASQRFKMALTMIRDVK